MEVAGVEYFVYWDALHVGASFFIPTVATPDQVRAALKPVAAKLDMRFEVRPRVEYGRYGSRVWRVY